MGIAAPSTRLDIAMLATAGGSSRTAPAPRGPPAAATSLRGAAETGSASWERGSSSSAHAASTNASRG
eukprot:4107990-Pyramimonas_sp.AAC.1